MSYFGLFSAYNKDRKTALSRIDENNILKHGASHELHFVYSCASTSSWRQYTK